MRFNQTNRDDGKQFRKNILDPLWTVDEEDNDRKMLPLHIPCTARMKPAVSAKAGMSVKDSCASDTSFR